MMPKIIENPQAIILQHAGRILEQQGYEAFNMRAVARSCGIATGTIYNYFPTKRHLLGQMMTEYWEMHFASLDEITAGDDNLFTKLKIVFDIMEEFVLSYREVWVNMRQESEQVAGPDSLHHRQDYLQRLIEKVEIILDRDAMRDPGSLNYPLPSDDMASFIVQNYLIMCQMKSLSYPSLEVLLRKILQ